MLPTLACLALALPAQRPQPPTRWATFVRAFDAYAAGDSVVGASVLLVTNGRVAAHHEYGAADRALGQRVDTATIYHWASITKTLTAIAILQLRDRGRLSLDDHVTKWIPELRQVHDSFGAVDDITIRMLLSHSAGFQGPTWPWTRGQLWEPFEPTRWEQLVAMMPYEEILFPPGSRSSYSNPGFIYLARIIEQITGDPWETYVQKNILTPLGLTRSYFGITPYHLAASRSNNYTVTKDSAGRVNVIANGRDFDPGITIPNGGWNAPLGDLARYLAFLGGPAHGDTILARASLEEMWRARYLAVEPVAGEVTPADSMGLSFFILWRGGTRFVGHTGHQAGFRSFFYINPATGSGVVAAFNTTNEADNDRSEAGFRAVRDSALALLVR
ncbi:MAG: serine hydrolase [Gemmatimonadetes bacterium]|nr:MAG: serine hydrolase [Gemmatimonadota bacterium]